MAWKLRVDILRLGEDGRPDGFVSSETLSGAGAAAVWSTPSPSLSPAAGVAPRMRARVSILSGAVIARLGAAPASDADGQRAEAGTSIDLALDTGARLAFVEAADAPIAREAHLGEVGGASAVVTATLVRPSITAAYQAGQLVGPSASAGAMTPMALACARKTGGTGMIRRVRLATPNAAAAGAALRVHLFTTAPAFAAGDGAAFKTAIDAATAGWLGGFDVTLDQAFADGAAGVGTPASGTEALFQTASDSSSLYALVEARSAYAPLAGETLTLSLEVLRD